MIMNSFPRTQGQLSREQYLTLLLLALLDQCDGELRLNAKNLDAVDSGGKLLVDWDTASQQLVLRVGSPTLVVAEVRGSGWTSVSPGQPPQQPTPPADPTKHRAPMTEQQVLDYLTRKVSEDRMRQWREQGAAAISEMPPPEPSAT